MGRISADVGGYVLAGGKSSRMGQDKALLELAGRPLALHAVMKLRRVCADIHILSGRTELEVFAPLVRDLHEGCGPLGGIEAALEHSRHDWSLFMPVDMPFLPIAFLNGWMSYVIDRESLGTRMAMFTVDETPQPLFCLLHKEVAPFVLGAMERGEFKVFPILAGAGEALAARLGVPLGTVFINLPWGEDNGIFFRPDLGQNEPWWTPTKAQQETKHLWFANLNTPEEFAEAERFVDALDI